MWAGALLRLRRNRIITRNMVHREEPTGKEVLDGSDPLTARAS